MVGHITRQRDVLHKCWHGCSDGHRRDELDVLDNASGRFDHDAGPPRDGGHVV